MMQAYRIHSFGSPEMLRLEDVPIPEPKPDEVLLKIHAAGVNPVDFKIRRGQQSRVTQEQLPIILGREASGTVEAYGREVRGFREGDAVHAILPLEHGGYAEYSVVKASAVHAKSERLDHVAAAAVPLAGLTAWQGLFAHGELKSGQRVLIHAGAGGVGHFAIQFAKARGAYVYTTVSERHTDFVRKLGADEVIDYTMQRFEDCVRDVDMVFDLIGGETQQRSFAVLRKGGILVSILNPPSPEKANAYGVRATRFTVEPDASDLAQIDSLIDMGKVRPVVIVTFPFPDAAKALEYVERGHTQGKVVIQVLS